jgi:hypothetical protein
VARFGARDGGQRNRRVERDQAAAVLDGEGEKIGVFELTGPVDPRRVEEVLIE